MEYKLNFDDNGNLHGSQRITYMLEGLQVNEYHLMSAGREIESSFQMQVFDPTTCISYFFGMEHWGTVEICRDAAEYFAVQNKCYGLLQGDASDGLYNVLPNTEEYFVNVR